MGKKSLSSDPVIAKKKTNNIKERQNVKKKVSDELDSLFSSRKKNVKKTVIEELPKKQDDDWMSQAIKNGSKGHYEGRTVTEEGYPVYVEEEIVSKTGGDTPQCPFDCKCCY